MLVYDLILDMFEAEEIAYEQGLAVNDAAAYWFKEVFGENDFNEEEIAYKEFIKHIPEIGCNLYLDFYCNYYFLVKQ